MAIITISRGSYHHGRSVAEKLAKKLGYPCISRDQIIDGLDEFRMPEIKLKRNLNDAFSLLDRFPNGKQRYITAMRAALLQRFMAGDLVYHGLSGHHYIKTISHVLKVRIVADLDSRIEAEMQRSGITAEQARQLLKKDDEERRKWAMFLYDIDLFDSSLYNLVIRIGHLSEEDAVNIIADASRLPAFQETEQSRAALADAALSAMVQQALFDYPTAGVRVSHGNVQINMKVPENQKQAIIERVTNTLEGLDGIKDLLIHTDTFY
ncbi:MAG: cytidylate kinase-like family protein [Desulfobacteraceae bacterium]|nr:cytidylate kinase-like family protein [Desulfobacteraceae bacterium]